MAAETLLQFQDYIREVLPNRVNSTTIITFLNNEIRKHWRDMASTSLDEIYTVANQELYTLPTACEFAQIVPNGVLVSDSTQGSTNATFKQYSYRGQDDGEADYAYYDSLGGTFGILPIPTVTNCPIHIRYKARPTLFASTDTARQFDLDEDYIDLLRFRVMARIAKAGNNPDVEIANGYEADAMEIERRMKIKKAKDKVKTARKTVSYKENWNC